MKRSVFLQADNLDGIPIEGNFAPLSNNVFVKVKEVAPTTVSGIFIPDNAKERPCEGTVVSTGPGMVHPETGVRLEMTVPVGANVMYGQYDGNEMKFNGVNHQMIKDDDVLVTYTGTEATLQTVQCIKDLILIKLPPKEDTSQSGIIINAPGSNKKAPTHGTVVKVGPGKPNSHGVLMTPPVQPGDQVRFREYGATPLKLEGEDYILTRSFDILAKW